MIRTNTNEISYNTDYKLILSCAENDLESGTNKTSYVNVSVVFLDESHLTSEYFSSVSPIAVTFAASGSTAQTTLLYISPGIVILVHSMVIRLCCDR